MKFDKSTFHGVGAAFALLAIGNLPMAYAVYRLSQPIETSAASATHMKVTARGDEMTIARKRANIAQAINP